MHRPPTITAVVTLVVLLAGCAHDHADRPADRSPAVGASPIAEVFEVELPDPVAAPTTTPGAARNRPQAGERPSLGELSEPILAELAAGGPDGVAARTVIGLLEAEDLEVLHVETHRDTGDAGAPTGRVSVVVSVLHGTGRSHPHPVRYRLGLVETDAGWDVTAIGAAS